MSSSSLENEFLLKEYDSAQTLTYHIDELRAKLTSFFLTFCGVAAAALLFLLKGEADDESSGMNSPVVVANMMVVVAWIGVIIVSIIARLRRVQIEHFRIISNVRRHMLGKNIDLWNTVELSHLTVPSPNRKSGSYLWALIVMLVSAGYGALGLMLHLTLGEDLLNDSIAKVLTTVCFLVFVVLLDLLYFYLACPTPARVYSVDDMNGM